MKQLDWRAFVLGLTFLSTTAFAVEVFYGQTGSEDWYFNDQVLIDGVVLPDDLSGTTGTSTVTVEGEGTLMVGSRSQGAASLNIMVTGGTTISVARNWDEADTKTWWEGTLPAPKQGQGPVPSLVSFVTTGKHPNSWVYPLVSYSMGLHNETYSFSAPATFTLPVDIPDGTKLWMAVKEEVTPSENATAEWTITEGDFCVVTNGSCQFSLAKMGEVALVQEYFTQCPRSEDSNTNVENGSIGNPPECKVTCDKGFELDYENMKCVSTSGESASASPSTSQGNNNVMVTDGGVAGVPPGYFRFTGSREQLRRMISTEGLEGEARTRAERQNATVRETNEAVVTEEAPATDSGKDGFLNYLLQIRNFFGAGSSANVVSSEALSEGAESPAEETDTEEHSSAPLLPSTGPGIFLSLAALGLGCMVVGRKGK